MSEEKPIPAEMLDAAARVIAGYDGWPMPEIHAARLAEAALRAAGVLELAARIAELEAALQAEEEANRKWRECGKELSGEDPLCYACYKRYEKAAKLRETALSSRV